MVYGSADYVQKRLANANLGTAGGNRITDAQLTEMLTEVSALINIHLGGRTTDLTDEPYATALRKVCIDVVFMMILQGDQMKDQARAENITSFWAMTPEFTPAHMQLFSAIVQQNETFVYNYNTRTGARIR